MRQHGERKLSVREDSGQHNREQIAVKFWKVSSAAVERQGKNIIHKFASVLQGAGKGSATSCIYAVSDQGAEHKASTALLLFHRMQEMGRLCFFLKLEVDQSVVTFINVFLVYRTEYSISERI